MLAFAGAPISAVAATPSNAALSSMAAQIYDTAKPRLLQIRTLLAANGQQTSLGSSFLVDASGLAITNYHVVSQYVLEPELYRLEYVTAEGVHGKLNLLGFDLANDLALIRIENADSGFFAFDGRALGDLANGERLYAMGNPLDLGFAIVEGTYNGLVERSYGERIHFSGALNPGMSGGPSVAENGKVVGINVATQLGGQLISFLVPARFAANLIQRAQNLAPPAPKALHAELARQMLERQTALYRAVEAAGFRTDAFGPYAVPESAAKWFTCWAQTNAGQVPKPRATIETTTCNSDTSLYISNELSIGLISVSNSYAKSVDLNQFQFATLLSQQNRLPWTAPWREKWYTRQRCEQNFTIATAADKGPPVEAIWCARAYKDFDGLYDVAVMTVTQDRGAEALVSRLGLQGVTYDDAIALTKHFFEALQWTK